MNKQEIKKKRMYFKNVDAIKYVKYIKIISFVLILLILLYTGLLSVMLNQPLSEVVSKNMSVVSGFIMAMASLFNYFLAINTLKIFQNIKMWRVIVLNCWSSLYLVLVF